MDFAKRITRPVACLVVVTLMAASAQAQPAVPAPSPPTLWQFLGFPKGFLGQTRAQLVNRRGNRPGLEKKPPLRNLADPANLAPEQPKAIQEAAKIKQAEDAAPQKIKAIKYLGMIGCGCYPGVKEGLLEALDDCTEEVRYEAVQAFITASGNICQACSETCCDEEVVAKLRDMAYGLDEQGCPKEPSARVRAAAAQAAQRCEAILPPPMEEVRPQLESPEGGSGTLQQPETRYRRAPQPGMSTTRQAAMEAIKHPQRALRSIMDSGAETYPSPSSRIAPPPTPRAAALPQPVSAAGPNQSSPHHLASLQPQQPVVVALPKVTPDRPSGKTLKGNIAWVAPGGGNMRLNFPESETPVVGEELRVYHDYLTGRRMLGRVQVIGIGSDGVWARPLGNFASEAASGDLVSTAPTNVPAEQSVETPSAPTMKPAPKSKPTPSVALPLRPMTPEVRVTDARPQPLQQPLPMSNGPKPVVEKHLPPRPTVKAMPIGQTAPPARIFDAPGAASVKNRPLPLTVSGRLPSTKPQPVATPVAAAPIWVGDSGKATKTK